MSLAVGEPASAEPQAVLEPPAVAPPTTDPAAKGEVAEVAEPSAPAAAEVADPAAPAEGAVPPVVDAPDEPAAAEPAVAEPAVAEGAEPAEPAEVAEVDAPEPAAPAEPAWWDACVGKVCAVDFGAITGGLLVRRGTVEHGATINWDSDYASAPRVDVLPTEPNIKVKVHGVALDAEGVPAAAEVVWNNGVTRIAGVISLNLGDATKRVRFIAPTAP
ncbi:MAG: hypothetical protein R3F39_22055 [Myxococcota bacterium]